MGHLFVVNIKFHDENPKTLLFNEIYPPIFEINKRMEPFKGPMLQLMTVLNRNEEEDTINKFAYNSKTHFTLGDKKFIPLYAKDPHFFDKTSRLVGYLYL